MGTYNLEVKNLVKKYGDFVAVDNLSFSIKRGEIYALLGPNGAGKTSTFESIEGLLPITSGEIIINGEKVNKKKGLDKNIGIQLQDSSFQGNMKVLEIIKLVSMYYECEINEELYERLKFSEIENKKISQLSVGQKRKLTLFLAIMHEPKLIILDEPTAGLDVITKNEIYEILCELRDERTSILISSHDMSEIERLADRIGVIVKGKLLKEGSALEMTNDSKGTKKIILKTFKGAQFYYEELKKYQTKSKFHEEYLLIYTKDIQNSMIYLMKQIELNKDKIIDLRVEQPTLEEIFMQITKTGQSL